MFDGSSDATRVLGLGGLCVVGVAEVGGELILAVESEAVPVGCPACGVLAVVHGRRTVRVRDLPVGGRPVVIEWRKRILRCLDPDCETGTWTETSSAIAPRAVLTERARREVCRRVGEDGHSIAAVARDFGVGWYTAMAAVRAYGLPLVDDPGRVAAVAALGLDETSFLKATATSGTRMVTGLVDVDAGCLVEVLDGRSGPLVAGWLARQGADWLAGIRAVSIDPFRGYALGVAAHLGHAQVVVDHFHLVRLANAAVDDVRRRTQQATTGHRGRSGDPLYGIRRLLLVAYERLGGRALERIDTALAAGDPYDEVAAAWTAKENLRAVYDAADLPEARRRLVRFYEWVADIDVAEVTRLARTISAWEAELLAYWTTGGITNGRTEAINLLIKKIKRVGHGFRNFENYRLRLLLHCGIAWNTPPTARLRSRPPRLAA